MPIVFIHGVAVRNSERKLNAWWPDLLEKLRRYAAPVISGRPDRVTILPAYWGALGVQFAWGGASRPLSVMLGKGGIRPAPDWLEQAVGLAEMPGLIRALPSAPAASESEGTLVAKGPGSTWSGTVSGRLKDLDPEELAALTMAAVRNAPGVRVTHPTEFFSDLSDDELRAFADGRTALAAIERAVDAAAQARSTPGALAAAPSLDEELAVWKGLVAAEYDRQSVAEGGLVGKGIPAWLTGAWETLKEAAGRASSSPGYVLTQVLTEFRKPANDLVTLFFGDVFAYINSRGLADPTRNVAIAVIDTLVKAREDPDQDGEPLVVLTHSMGGQIAYDLVTHFLPKHPDAARLRVDFWCATASQVGLFEEMKLFLASVPQYSKAAGNRVPYPSRQQLGVWWNLWDSNDFISYTARPIFETREKNPMTYGVIDEEYSTGRSVLAAHSGYFLNRSFFTRFVERLQAGKEENWWRP